MHVDAPAPEPLPTGFVRFHRRSFVDYQLNRAHSLGLADRGELVVAAASIRSARDCVPVFDELADVAERDGRLRHAMGYVRIAEFFSAHGSPDALARYVRFRSLFEASFAGTGIVRHDVPYGTASLPAYRVPAAGGDRLGTVLVHGGFDSLIEEFVAICRRVAAAGFDVIAFDGPGQGGARRLGNLTFDHDWERPVGAVLDHFEVGAAGLVGISMGGYWALRAAGREPRIDRVVSWPPVYDWLERVPPSLRGLTGAMLRRRRFMRWSVRVRTRLVPTLRTVVDQACYNAGGDDPLDAVDWFLGMNRVHLGSERVTQDVLVMCGAHDRFQPPVLARAQAAALTNARTVTTRVFTAAEHADQHCQMGNLELACSVLTGWLRAPGPLVAGSS